MTQVREKQMLAIPRAIFTFNGAFNSALDCFLFPSFIWINKRCANELVDWRKAIIFAGCLQYIEMSAGRIGNG